MNAVLCLCKNKNNHSALKWEASALPIFLFVTLCEACQNIDMYLELKFPFPPLSQNNIERTGSKTNIRYKTQEAKQYKQNMNYILRLNRKRVDDFVGAFCGDYDGVVVEFWWCINHELCLTKKRPRRLSKRGGDYDNYIKFTQDVFFDFMNVNDFYIHSARQYKVPVSGETHFIVKIKIEKLSKNPHFSAFL